MEARLTAPDVLIVGAGVVGAALAYELARQGRRVVVVERAAAAGLGATRWSLGGTHWLTAQTDPRLRDLCREGLERHQRASAELGVESGFHARPILALAPDEPILTTLGELLEQGRRHGFEGRLVDRAELARLEPALRPEAAVGAALCAFGWLDTVTATRAWLQAATRHGGEVRVGVDVQRVRLDGARPVIETAAGPIEAGQVVLAAGAWLSRLLRRSDVRLPLLHTHAEVLESEPLPPTFRHVVVNVAPPERARGALEQALARPEHRVRFEAEDGAELLPPHAEIGVVQLADGRARLGQVSRAVSGFLDGPCPDGEAAIRAEVARFFPDLARRPARLHARPVSFSADRLPIAGPLPGVPACWIVGGLVSPLVYLPALAAAVAAALVGEPAPALEPFAPARLAETA